MSADQPILFPGSPPDPEDREYLDSFAWTPELLLEFRNRAKALVHRYSGRDHFLQTRPGLERAGPGDCGDCGITAIHRERYGKFQLCEPCADRRLRLAEQIGAGQADRRETGWLPAPDDQVFTHREQTA